MKIVYLGPEDRVTVAPEGITFERDEPVIVPRELAERLLDQQMFARWTPAKRHKSPARAADANPDVESR